MVKVFSMVKLADVANYIPRRRRFPYKSHYHKIFLQKFYTKNVDGMTYVFYQEWYVPYLYYIRVLREISVIFPHFFLFNSIFNEFWRMNTARLYRTLLCPYASHRIQMGHCDYLKPCGNIDDGYQDSFVTHKK